ELGLKIPKKASKKQVNMTFCKQNLEDINLRVKRLLSEAKAFSNPMDEDFSETSALQSDMDKLIKLCSELANWNNKWDRRAVLETSQSAAALEKNFKNLQQKTLALVV